MSGTETCSLPDAPVSSVVVCKDVAESRDGNTRLLLHSCDPSFDLSNGISSVAEGKHRRNPDYLDVRDDQTEISEDSLSLPDVCSPHAASEDEDLNYEVQQAFKIFHSFLLEKHKAITAPFWLPIGPEETSMLEPPHQGMSLKRIDEKFVKREYESITDFVADFRLLLENCYRHHGVDHWISKQAQKLEIILEQKLTLLSRTLRDKTTLAVTSKGRFGTEDEKVPVGSSMRRRSVPRSLATITVGGSESLMVQALRLEERQRAKEEKRQRELEKKEAEEASAKEVVEWDHDLLSQAAPWPVETLWELPAIGHFLCLAQNALNLPEIVFFELERCLLMPRCSTFLAKIMTSLLCQPHRRATLHRRPALSYRCWEAELRRKVVGWYQAVGRAEDQAACAEQLGLCNQFFWTLGESSPLEEAAFHLLPFNQRVWLLKGLCDNVYETHKDVQDAVLGQPIHECRESILGYDIRENAYIHFPHFCGADLRIYCQSPCTAVDFPLPPIRVQRLEKGAIVQGFIRPKEEVHSVKTKEEAFEMEKLMEEADRDCLKEDSGDGNLLEELRDLINKTEDEMDELESTKKKSGRWYYKREAVKELHMTLIRLLNELSPWEPKLVKAFQRNRARLKKDYDDFKKHPDYCKFVREKRLEEEVEAVKGLPEATDLSPETEEANKSELDEMGNSSQLGTEPFPSSSVFGQDIDNVNEHRPFTRSSKRQLSGVTDEDLCHNKRAKVSIMDPLSTEYLAEEVARESSPAVQILQSSGETSTSFTTAANSHKSYTPIQALLAKSVGNKVTLIKHNPAAVTEANQPIQSKSSSEPLSSSNTLSVNTAPPTVHNTSTPAQVQVVYKLPGDLGVNRKDNSPLNFSVQPVVDTKAVETRMQQVIFLPPNLLVQRSDGKEPQHPGVFPLPASKTLVPPNDCSGFTVAPLEDQCLIQTPSPTVSSSLCATSVPPYKGVESQKVTTADSNKCPSTNPPDTKQELKTVCIRDSQSILVTTRGGNTGVVKVQTSDQSTVNSLPASPVFTLSPKFKAILVSKSSPSFASSQPAVTTTAQSQPTAVPLFSRPSPLTCVNQVLPSGVDTVNAKKSTSTYDTVSVLNKIHSSVAGSQTVPTQSIGTVNSPLSQGGVGVLLAGIPNIPPPIPSNTVQKRSQTDLGVPDQSPFQKIFLVTPPANVSVCGMSKGPMDSALSGSKLMLINQTTASSCSAVAVPKQPLFTHASTSTVVESGSLNQVQSIMPRPPTTEAALPLKNSIPVTVSGLLTTNTGGLICPIRSRSLVTNSVRQYLPVQSIKGPEGIPSTVKTLQFSALSTGSFAGSTLLTAAQLQSVPMSASTTVSSFSCKKTDQAASSILSTVIPSVGGVISKDQSLVKGLSPNSPCFPSPVVTSSAAMPVMAPPGTFRPLTLSSNIPSQHANLPHPHKTVVTPTVRPPADCSSASTVQQKIVINTSAPLAPGTQILINNACFVVPAQGLAPGSHVLVIPRPVASPGDATALPRLPGIPVPSPVPQSSQGPRMTTPGKQPQLGALKAPLPFTVKVQQSCTSVLTPVPCQGTLKEHLPTSSSSALAAASQLACSSVSTSQHTEPTAMRFSSALIPEGKAITVPPVPMLDSYPKPTATSSAQAQGASQFTVNQTLLHAGFPLSQTQLTSVLPPVGPVVSQKKALSVVTTVAASSVCSRLLTLPVATVPPTGSTFSNRPTNPNTAAAPPSNTVIMEMCPPIRTMPVVLTNPPLNLGKTTLHSSTPGALPSSSPKKLLLSPDGAVLNVVRGPVVAALPTLAAQMGLSSSDQGVVPSAQTSQGELNC
uniref:Bromo domain-containing protein n=1 Tax=Denticeps clupeoides TaxID=299321 RepID=A0AAY4DT69_9TELE